jgi:hypothetical protein
MCTADDQSPQLQLIPDARIVVNYDPATVPPDPPPDFEPAAPLDLSTSFEEGDWWEPQHIVRARYAAWVDGFPWAVGEGKTPREALADLARYVREEPWCYGQSLMPPKQLVRAVKSLSPADAVAYLERLGTSPELADEYSLVLR